MGHEKFEVVTPDSAMTANVQGLLLWWNSVFRQPGN